MAVGSVPARTETYRRLRAIWLGVCSASSPTIPIAYSLYHGPSNLNGRCALIRMPNGAANSISALYQFYILHVLHSVRSKGSSRGPSALSGICTVFGHGLCNLCHRKNAITLLFALKSVHVRLCSVLPRETGDSCEHLGRELQTLRRTTRYRTNHDPMESGGPVHMEPIATEEKRAEV